MEEKQLTKRYWLFGGAIYYASGGMRDFNGSFDREEEAKAKAKEKEYTDEYNWYHILDTQEETINGVGEACNPMGIFR